MITLGSISAWLAGTRAAAGAFLNKNAALAIIAVIVAVTVLAGGVLAWTDLKSSWVAANDAGWRARAAAAARNLAVGQAERDRRAEAAAAAEREILVNQIREVAEHAVTLEQEIARLKAAGGDPVIYPHSLVKELRK